MDQDLSLVLEPAFWSPFFLEDTLLSLNLEERAFMLPQSDLSDFLGSPWEAIPFLSSGWEVGLEEDGEVG